MRATSNKVRGRTRAKPSGTAGPKIKKSNSECRQGKRSTKQEGREESRDVRAGKPTTTQ
jgi:hypothetical protein